MHHVLFFSIEDQGMRSVLQWRSGRAIAAITATAAGLALINAAAAWKAERRNWSGGSFLHIDGVKLHNLSKGEGPAIVLLHGNGSMIQDWVISGLVDKLSLTHRGVVFDRPGFGYSGRRRSKIWTPEAQADLLAMAALALKLEAPTVVGHSFGTLVAIAFALNHPELVSRLVLIGGYYYPSARVDAALSSAPAIPTVGDLMRYTVSPLAGRALGRAANRKLFAPAPVSRAWKDNYPADMVVRPLQIRAIAAEAALMVPAAAALSRRYERLALPITIVAGAGVRIVDPQHQSAKLYAELPGSKFLLVAGAGHMVHHTAADKVGEAILDQAQPC